MEPELWMFLLVATAQTVGVVALALVVAQNVVYLAETVLAVIEMKRNRELKRRTTAAWLLSTRATPGISLLVPAHNEERTIVENIRSLLTLRYATFEIIVVNDGSRDATAQRVIEAFHLQRVEIGRPLLLNHKSVRGVYRCRDYPNLLFVDKENGGKADALNAAINYSRHPLVCAVDADSLLDHNALLRAARPFVDHPSELVAVGGTIRIANGCEVRNGTVVRERAPRRLLPLFQAVEYLRSFLIARLAFSRMDAVSIISGAFGLFKRSAVVQVGGYTQGTVGEDMELIIKLHRYFSEHRQRYHIMFVPDPVCWTEAPENIKVLRRQRTRWQRGLCETLWKHRRMVFNPRYGRIGLLGLPQFALFDVLGPALELAGFVLLPLLGLAGLLSWKFVAAYFAVSVFFGIFLSVMALVLAEFTLFNSTSKRDMVSYAVAAIVENFGYRQLNSLWRIEGIWQFLRRRREWGEMTRTGFEQTKPGSVKA